MLTLIEYSRTLLPTLQVERREFKKPTNSQPNKQGETNLEAIMNGKRKTRRPGTTWEQREAKRRRTKTTQQPNVTNKVLEQRIPPDLRKQAPPVVIDMPGPSSKGEMDQPLPLNKMNRGEATKSQEENRTRTQNNHYRVDRGDKGMVVALKPPEIKASTSSRQITAPKRQLTVSKVSKTINKARNSPSRKKNLPRRDTPTEKRSRDIREYFRMKGGIALGKNKDRKEPDS